MQLQLTHANKVISLVASKSSKALLFYSGGKDNIVLLDLMAKHFDEIVLVFMYLVPGLEQVDKYLSYSKAKYPNVRILQVPHWNLSYINAYGLFTEPKDDVRMVKLRHIDETVREQTGIDYTFYGMKKADGMSRRIMLSQYHLHAITDGGKVYPLSLWTKQHVLEYIRHHKLPSPIEYTKHGRSQGLGLNADCMLYLRDNYPNDLKKMLAAFPLAEKILIDHANKVPGIHG